MTRLACWVIIGCVVTALGTGPQAQEPSENGPVPSEDTLQNWLRSGDPRLEAWGAHDVLRTRDQQLIPDLVDLTEKWEPLAKQECDGYPCSALSKDQLDKRNGMQVVLNTLIQLNVAVSTDTLRDLAQDFPVEVAMLLPRLSSDESSALNFELYKSPPPEGNALQYVSAALLAMKPPPGFAADLLGSIKVTAIFEIVSPGALMYGSGGDSGSCGAVLPESHNGWPPIPQHFLFRQTEAESSLVVGGVNPVYAGQEMRSLADERCQSSGSLFFGADKRLRLIAEMLGTPPEEMPWSVGNFRTIEFQSVEQCRQEILAFVTNQLEKYRSTANALSDKGLIEPSDIETAMPELDLELRDRRDIPGEQIPPTIDLPAHVKWLASGLE